jgi:hypothetical protein
MATPFRIKRSAVPTKAPQVDDLQFGELALNTYDAELYTLRARAGFATDVVRVGSGASVTNILYVTKDGKDTNTGKKLGDAKATIKAAVAIASTIPGSVVKVSAGTYVEDNPIKCGKQISIIGDSLREVTVVPNNSGEDLFHLAPGNYLTEMSFTGTMNSGKSIFAFDPDTIRYSGQSPYLRNCTNFVTNSIGMKIDGNHVIGPFKSFVTDSYTQYNQNGIGCSVTNEGYAQIVSLFTINDDIGVFCGSGGQCDITNSNSSFGNYGLVADGVGPNQFTGTINSATSENADSFILDVSTPTIGIQTAEYNNTSGIVTITTNSAHNLVVGMGVTLSGLEFSCAAPHAGVTTTIFPDGTNGYIFNVNSITAADTFDAYVGPSTIPHTYQGGGDVAINVVRPYDGQVVYFEDLYYTVGTITLTNPGSGYNSAPTITISDPSTSSTWGITATALATLTGDGVGDVEILSNGRGYTTTPTITFSAPDVGINRATATIELLPTYYSVKSSTPISSGICTITVNENLPYSVGIGTTVPFYKQSRILASSHSFEYIGSGTDPITSLPSRGGVAIQENEVDNRNGGLVIYTSTDQGGNFRIGEGVVIDQISGTISGNFYSKSLFANVTPLILALGGE